jgi:hypothetical protein
MDQQYATTIIAVAGLIIALFSFGLSLTLGILEIKRYTGRIRVKILWGTFYDLPDSKSERIISIRAENIGYGDTYIVSGGWYFKDSSSAAITKPLLLEFPTKLEQRRGISIYYPCRWFKERPDVNNIIGAYVLDDTGRRWSCRLSKQTLQKLLMYKPDGWKVGQFKDNFLYYRQDSENGSPIPFRAEGFMSSEIK